LNSHDTTEIFYFSGTGNSLFVAKEVSKRIANSKITPIAACLSQDRCNSSADRVGIVFPEHALTIPIILNKFLRKLEIAKANYIFVVVTRFGTEFHGFEKIDRIFKRKRKMINSAFVLNMYNNDSRHGNYIVPTLSDLKKIELNTIDAVEIISGVVREKKLYRAKDSTILYPTSNSRIMSWLIRQTVLFSMSIAEYVGGANYFYHDEKCSGCGVCEKVCLSKKVEMVEKEPTWNRGVLCYMCFACLNFCPKTAVQIKSIPGVESFSVENGRYPHPYATVKDMQEQKGYRI
jgi:Pyruvate/2-oxoacid:ferredoxin oxidoreductase delta subunit